jgi:hypothetical protein
MAGGMYYIADIMHNLLRVVPHAYLHTVHENCDEDQLKQVEQWCYESLSLIKKTLPTVTKHRDKIQSITKVLLNHKTRMGR